MISPTVRRRVVAGGVTLAGTVLLISAFSNSPQQRTGGIDTLVQNPEDGQALLQSLNPKKSFSTEDVDGLEQMQAEDDTEQFLQNLEKTYSTLGESQQAIRTELAANVKDLLVAQSNNAKSSCSSPLQCLQSSINDRVEKGEKNIQLLADGKITRRQFLEKENTRIEEIRVLLIATGEFLQGTKVSRDRFTELAPTLYQNIPTVSADIRLAIESHNKGVTDPNKRKEIPRPNQPVEVALKQASVVIENSEKIFDPIVSQDVAILPCSGKITEMSPEAAAKCNAGAR